GRPLPRACIPRACARAAAGLRAPYASARRAHTARAPASSSAARRRAPYPRTPAAGKPRSQGKQAELLRSVSAPRFSFVRINGPTLLVHRLANGPRRSGPSRRKVAGVGLEVGIGYFTDV